jgi:hypothetical protein
VVGDGFILKGTKMFNNQQAKEDFDAWVNRNDRFDGFDRGDVYELVDPVDCAQDPSEDIEF